MHPSISLNRAASAALLAFTALAATAQTAADPISTPTRLERVEVTGSSIKRIASEAALPVQTITREDIDKAGVTTAAELLAKVSANTGGLTDGASINVGGYDQKGFNSANLRGLGTSSTLVLLNGRRMANFASPGDDAGVDLNNIPAAAIQRVEILLDGASAIYGTDAIGGVINFITRQDYRGAEVSAYVGKSQEGGAGKRTASVAAGTGQIDTDGYNVFGVFDVQRTDSLRTSQRDFIGSYDIPNRLGHLLSSRTYPANIRLSADQRDYLQAQGYQINGQVIENRQINPAAPACNPPANLYLPNGTGGRDACTYDYMRDTELYPKSEKLGLLSRGVLKLGGDQQLFAEVALTRAKTTYVGSSTRVNALVDVSQVPSLAATGLGAIDPELEVRARLSEAGNRTSEVTSTGQRYVVGLSGVVAGWDYDTAVNHSANDVVDADVAGYVLFNEVQAGIAAGTVNLFGPSGPEGLALLRSIQVNDKVRRARGTMDSIDVKASRGVMALAGGDLAVALGAELRREKFRYGFSELFLSDNINEDFAPEEDRGGSNARRVGAVYGELNAPVTKALELQFALRYDHYQGVGDTTNPKVGLRYEMAPSLLMRSSFGTGFRAPSLSDLYRPTIYSATSTLPDPTYCAAEGGDLSICADNWDTRRYSNTKLKPERSRQLSVGTVFEPSRHWSFSLDYWHIAKRDIISEIGDDVILAHLDRYEPLVHRYNEDEGLCDYDPDDATICFIELRKENRGRQKASGLDLVAELRDVSTAVGRFGARLSGTYVLQSKQQPGPGDAYISNLGRFVTDGVVQRWRHRASVDWSQSDFGLTLANTYFSGYEDQNSAINIDDGSVVAANRVKAYSLWDVSAAWQASKQATLRAGVQNLFDTAPPYSNQAYYFLSGYDPSYTDPRGRFFYVSGVYRF